MVLHENPDPVLLAVAVAVVASLIVLALFLLLNRRTDIFEDEDEDVEPDEFEDVGMEDDPTAEDDVDSTVDSTVGEDVVGQDVVDERDETKDDTHDDEDTVQLGENIDEQTLGELRRQSEESMYDISELRRVLRSTQKKVERLDRRTKELSKIYDEVVKDENPFYFEKQSGFEQADTQEPKGADESVHQSDSGHGQSMNLSKNEELDALDESIDEIPEHKIPVVREWIRCWVDESDKETVISTLNHYADRGYISEDIERRMVRAVMEETNSTDLDFTREMTPNRDVPRDRHGENLSFLMFLHYSTR